ncbi:MAG TPA: PD-(D/E)XK nuclease family protein [Candidatus Paceibacterota bacterium]|nr:PD-(D/E)XK nuclease family protein [Candidatus Paceibacterota bacterium]
MQIRFLVGPAGSGKTHRCLEEIRRRLLNPADSADLILLAPRQSTFQLERQILEAAGIPGYTRLQILSFERLAHATFQWRGLSRPALLEEEGRVMVLRSLLARHRQQLQLFRASARLTGFAQQLSLVLRELQRAQMPPALLRSLAAKVEPEGGLRHKLEDLAVLAELYDQWLARHQLQDADSLLDTAAKALREPAVTATKEPPPPAGGRCLWVDGFAEFSLQEVNFLAAVAPHCDEVTLTFCLEDQPKQKVSWLSSWSLASENHRRCQQMLSAVPGARLTRLCLPRQGGQTRFKASPVLRHLEEFWDAPEPWVESRADGLARPLAMAEEGEAARKRSLRVVACGDLEGEVVEAAREILRFVRAGGRYRETAVLMRDLERYQGLIRRVFAHYEIPCFLDRREAVAHHPLAELTRNALRTVAYDWQNEDWFAALKTGLLAAEREAIDWLENEALARGWQGKAWLKPIEVAGDIALAEKAEGLRLALVKPFQRLGLSLAAAGNRPSGVQLAAALRQLWGDLQVEQTLAEWALREDLAPGQSLPKAVHATVWEQMNNWLENLELAFSAESLPLRDWLPIVDAGLATLTVGVIPPVLDQVLVGTLDRLRNPDVRLGILLGLNEGVFPAAPAAPALLTESDRQELAKWHAGLGGTVRHHQARERYLAYIACTRPRERLVLTHAQSDSEGAPLNPSAVLSHLRRLFPDLEIERGADVLSWEKFEHAVELLVPLLRLSRRTAGAQAAPEPASSPGAAGPPAPLAWRALAESPAMAGLLSPLERLHETGTECRLSPGMAERLYGPVLRTSVSRMEQFAACPFKFFVHSGLRAEERLRFELDVREKGSFLHDLLALFHNQLRAENRRWRDLTPAEARARLGALAESLFQTYREGLLQVDGETQFAARLLTESLQDFIEVLVGWMRAQYQFDPVAVELPFGQGGEAPPWRLELGNGRCVDLYGRIDRVDLAGEGDGPGAYCVVVDYKSGQKKLDPVLLEHGLQLQLLAYLGVLRHWSNPQATFGVEKLIPAGVFYVNLRGRYPARKSRVESLSDPDQARREAYRHTGRFDLRVLRLLDSRADATRGDQFNYRLTKSGAVHRGCREPMEAAAFARLLDSIEDHLRSMGQSIFAGVVDVAPFRKGSVTACDHCQYQGICRIDPWIHPFRVLRQSDPGDGEAEEAAN